MFADSIRRSTKTIEQALTPVSTADSIKKSLLIAVPGSLVVSLIAVPAMEGDFFGFLVCFILTGIILFAICVAYFNKKGKAIRKQRETADWDKIRLLDAQIPDAPYLYEALCLLDTHVFLTNCMSCPEDFALIPYENIREIHLIYKLVHSRRYHTSIPCLRFIHAGGMSDTRISSMDLVQKEQPELAEWFNSKSSTPVKVMTAPYEVDA